MTGFHRFSILAIVTLLAAGCGATPATSAPTPSLGAVASPIASSSPPQTPSMSPPAPSPSPGVVCQPLAEDSWTPSADFSLHTPLGYPNLFLDVTRMSRIGSPDEFVEFEPNEPYLDEPGRLVGDWHIALHADIDYDEPVDVPVSLIAASAVLHVPGHSPIRMEGILGRDAETHEAAVLFDVPDVRGSVVIDFEVEWSDACYTYLAEGPAAYEMVRAAHAASCPTGHKGFAAHWAEMGEHQLQVGDIGVDITNHQIIGLWTSYAVWVQGGSALMSWDQASTPATGQAGGIIRVVPTNPDLRIRSLSATYYRRGAVLDHRPGDDPRRAFRAAADPFADGHLELLVPSEPGRYVAEIGVDWESPCAYGGAYAGVSIDVP